MARMRGLLGLAVVLAIAATACGNGGGGSSGGSSASSGGATSAGGGGTAVTIQDFAFNPDALDLAAGTDVSLTITNGDSVEHSFTLDDDSATVDIEGGETQTLTINVSGDVGWHCKYHPQMTGQITVG